jgi:hypothetical protein
MPHSSANFRSPVVMKPFGRYLPCAVPRQDLKLQKHLNCYVKGLDLSDKYAK